MSEPDRSAERDERPQLYVRFLESLKAKEDRAALAALRRSLGRDPGNASDAHRYVLRFNPPIWQEPAYYLVGGLFALHPASWPRDENDKTQTNLGASFARLRTDENSDAIERRFVALLDCHENDLPEHLRHAIGLLRAREIAVDWVRLLRDLCNWDHEEHFVQRAWARAFWTSGKA